MTKYPEIKDKFEKVLESNYIHKINDYDWDFDGYNLGDTVNKLWSFIEQSLEETEKRVREEVVEMLWNIHVDETDKEAEAWNRSLDLAIFKINNPSIQTNDNQPQDDLKDLGLKPLKLNLEKLSKLANIINKAMKKEENEQLFK